MKKHLSSAPSIRVRRRRGHAPSERKTAIAVILIICAVIIAVSAALCCKAGFPACSAQRTPPPQNTFVPTSASLPTAAPLPTSAPLPTAALLPTATPAPYTFVSVSVSDAAEGQLALVNFEHGFPAADSTDVVPVTAAGSLLTERNDLSLAQPAISALSALAEAFRSRRAATGCCSQARIELLNINRGFTMIMLRPTVRQRRMPMLPPPERANTTRGLRPTFRQCQRTANA